jgi:alginate O-acetyltransferase complex protein AlgJ
MTTTDRIPERERIAKIEIGQTDVSKALRWTLVLAFLAVIAIVPLVDLLSGRVRETGVTPSTLAGVIPVARHEGWIAGAYALLEQMHRFEGGLERKSRLGEVLLPRTQRVLTALGVGNEKVYIGVEGAEGGKGGERRLYYTPDVQYVAGLPFLAPGVLERRKLGGEAWEDAPHPDPLPALRDFQRQLARRGIRLIVMPTPVKPQIDPEGLANGRPVSPPLENRSWPELVRRLEAAGIPLFDPAPLLAQEKAAGGAPLYLRTDTHWTPEAMDLAAKNLAEKILTIAQLAPPSGGGYFRRAQTVSNVGDLAILLTLPPTHPLKEPERATIQRVETAEGRPWRADPQAEVLLLGDSFTNIYSQSDLGWGTGAGLAEQLAYHLARPVDRLALNSGGALNTRQRLAQELAAGNDRLAGKKVVVYQFAVRELSIGDWRVIGLGGGQAPAISAGSASVR